jgi:hypothetical protein
MIVPIGTWPTQFAPAFLMSLLSLVRADLGRRCPVVMEGKIGLQLMPKVHRAEEILLKLLLNARHGHHAE